MSNITVTPIAGSLGAEVRGVDLRNPDFGLFARAFGVRHWRAETDEAFEGALREAVASGETALVEVCLPAG